jgi:dTDP-4-amino-4,6-dideoxygalactose transaminase
VPALDLKAQYRTIQPEIDAAIRRVVESQFFCLGPEVAALEAEIAAYCGVAHAVGCSSGSDALLLALMAWDIGPGDEVITTPYTFFATAGAIWRLGARPVFVDIEPDTYNIAPAQVERAITPRTRAIIPVHLYGQAADMNALGAIARRYGLKVLEDAAQAIGARHHGRPVGSLGDAAAFSFYPSKNLGGYGDGGLVTTPDPATARRLARLRIHGMEPRYHHHEVGYNARLDALQAAVLRVKLGHLPAWTEARRQVAARYRALFHAHDLTDRIGLPIERPENEHVYNQFVIRVPETLRDPLRARLTERQIGSDVYYPIPLHLQLCFQALGHRPGDFPVAEQAARQTIALPIYPELSEEAQAYVVATIAEFFEEAAPETRSPAIPRPHVLGEVPSGAAPARRGRNS